MASAINPITSSQSTSAAAPSTSTAATSGTGLANESTFLQLLVAQLKNQDPSNPMDGTAFVTQLAQFSQLEQSIGMKSDLDGMLTDLNQVTAPVPVTTPSQGNTTAPVSGN